MENIKYHQNGTGNEYGEDGRLTNNWNPDTDYKNEYVNVHFRIDANYYQYPFTDYTQEQKQAFQNEVKIVFSNLGWEVDRDSDGAYCMDIVQDKQHLYLHPQDFSGEVLKNNVGKIAEALKENTTFKLRWVDLYETVYNITNEEYEEYLKTKDEEIRTALFERCQTARINKFYYIFDVARGLASSYRLTRIGLNDGKNYGSGQTIEHIIKIVEKMIEDKYLVCTMDKNENRLIRSINKTEQRKLKLNVA